ncbi:hypothetical protein LAZ67_13001200 [Cordylochernes scorpioides]|uniref:Uncharacterized protein n=1 Tax=Cordylochernes scorpioides TaxID=51811 RepID=A0ABY6L3M2_9ARAC|nr:hypothetical protein LAZ67_13001200 [Cordylochernes scorpioides]
MPARSLYLHECPVQPYVPIYLVVGGVFSIVKQVLQCVHGCIKDKETPNENKDPSCIKLLNLFLFAWFIAGCVWVYGCYAPGYDNPEDPLFCNKTVYLFSFWLLNSFFIFFGISLSIMCCIIICAIVLSED